MQLDLLLIRKKNNKSIVTLAKSVINSVKTSQSEDYFNYGVDKNKIRITYSFRKNSNDSLEISMASDVSESVENANTFSLLRETLLSEENKKQLNIIVLYDDASNIYSYKLMPFFGKFERKLRKLVYITVVKTLGNEWFAQTFTHDQKEFVKNRLTNKSPVENALEELDYKSLRQYLIQKHNSEQDIKELLETELSNENIKLLDKEEIIEKLQHGREYSLWEKLFIEYDDVSELPELLEDIREKRNQVMHQKTINAADYAETKKKLLNLIRLLDKSISHAEEKMYTETDKDGVAKSLSEVYSSLSESLLRISKIIEPSKEIAQRLQDITSSYKNVFEGLEINTADWMKAYSSQFKGLNLGTSSVLDSIVKQQKFASPLSLLAEEMKKYNTISSNLGSMLASYKFPSLREFDVTKDDDVHEDE